MRIHADPSHPDYKPEANRAEIYLNGEQMTKVIFADDERGVIERYKTDKAGNVIVKGGELVVEQRRGGDVCIFISDPS